MGRGCLATEGKMEGEDQHSSTVEKKECKSQRKLERQNGRASVVSSVVSSLGLTSSLSAQTEASGPSL